MTAPALPARPPARRDDGGGDGWTRHAKRAVAGIIASAVLVAVAWLIGWAFLPANLAANCWGCRVPFGFLGMMLIRCFAELIYSLGDVVIFTIAGPNE